MWGAVPHWDPDNGIMKGRLMEIRCLLVENLGEVSECQFSAHGANRFWILFLSCANIG